MRNLELRNMIFTALLLGMGLVFHTVVPGVLLGMKPDLILTFMFIAFLLNPKYYNAFIIGVTGGFLSGLTTSLPGGFIPNLVDKIITMHLVFVIFLILNALLKNGFRIKRNGNYIIAPLLSVVGTIISGTVFLTVAIILGALSKSDFGFLFGLIVLPATFANFVLTTFMYYVLNLALNRGNVGYKIKESVE